MSEGKNIANVLLLMEQYEKRAFASISELEALMYEPEGNRLEFEAEVDHQESILSEAIDSIDRLILFILEYLNVGNAQLKYSKEFSKYEDKLTQIEIDEYGDYAFSPALEYQRKYIELIRCLANDTPAQAFVNLESFLRGTNKIIRDRKIKPQNEAEIRQAIYDVMIHMYPDTVREIPIAKVSKTYKPDLGVKSLKAAIEYKFADSEDDAKRIIGEIYSDIHGYEGSEDWRTFFAVLYMTEAFLTPSQIEAEWVMSGVPHNWIPLVIYGPGKRRSLKKNKSAKKKKER